jgi:hypothetical protein
MTQACFLALLLAGSTHGITITPANPVPIYTLVRIEYEEGWRVFVFGKDFSPVDLVRDETDRLVVFVGPPGNYGVIAFQATQEGAVQKTVVIKGNGPAPDPDPDPEPPNGNEPEPGKLGLAVPVFKAGRKVPLPPRALAGILADNHSTAATQIRAGVKIETAMDSLRSANREIMDTAAKEAWLETQNVIHTRLTQLWKAGTINQPSTFAVALDEIARGLQHVAAD